MCVFVCDMFKCTSAVYALCIGVCLGALACPSTK